MPPILTRAQSARTSSSSRQGDAGAYAYAIKSYAVAAAPGQEADPVQTGGASMNRRLHAHALAAGLAAASLGLAGPALAADAVDELKVTAPKLEDSLPEALARSGVRVEIITDAAIRNGGYIDVAQALQQLAPGLSITPKNGPFDYVDISLQGSRTGDVLWLVDGVRINNRLYAGTPPLDTLPSAMVDRIEVLEGGQALFYGTSAVAGAVNIVTRPFSDSPDGAVSLAADTNGGRHIDAYFRDGVGRHHFVAYGSADKSDGFKAFRDQDYQPSATDRKRGYAVYTLGGKYRFDVSDQLSLTASYQHTDADLDYAQPYRVARNVNARKEDLAVVKVDYQPTERLAFYVKGYHHEWRTRYDTDYNDLGRPGVINVLHRNAFWGYKDDGVNALVRFDAARGVETYFGYDFQRYGGRDEVLVIDQHDEETQAVFGQVRITPDLIPRTRLAFGYRYNSPSVGKSAGVWNVSGRYDLTDSLTLKGEVGANFRLPTAEELFANDPLDERGNPNLKPERSTSANLSLGGRLTLAAVPVRWELVAFARDIEDLIDLKTYDPVTQQDVFGNVPGVVKTRGGEFLIDAALTPSLSANFNYTYNRARQDGGGQLQRTPKQLLKAGLDYHPADRPFGATLSLTHTGETFVSVAGAPRPYGDYTLVDLSGRYFLDAARRNEISVSIQNLFDVEYGKPARGCADVSTDGPYSCSSPYIYVNLGLPRTLRASFTRRF